MERDPSDTETGWSSTSRRKFLAASGLTAVAALGGCQSGDGGTDDMDVVRWGSLPIAAIAETLVAEERGYFEERNIELEWERVVQPTQASPQLTTGELDIVSSSIGAGMFNSIAQGIPVQVVADQTQYWRGQPSGLRVWVRDDLYTEGMSLSDIPGKPVIANPSDGSSIEYVWARVLQTQGMTWDDVEVETLQFQDHIPAMEAGEIDATAIPDPLGLQLAGQAGARQLMYGSEVVPRCQIGMYMFGEPFMNQRTDVAVRWLEGYLLGVREFYEMGGFPNEEVATIISDEIDIPVSAIQSSIPSLPHRNGKVNADSVMRQQEFHACSGYIDDTVPEDEVINEELLDRALENVGRLDPEEAKPSVDTIHQWSDDAPSPYAEVGDVIPMDDFPTESSCRPS